MCVVPFVGNAHKTHIIIPLAERISEEEVHIRQALKTRDAARDMPSTPLEERVIAEHSRILQAADVWMKQQIDVVRKRGASCPDVSFITYAPPMITVRCTALKTKELLELTDAGVHNIEQDLLLSREQTVCLTKLQRFQTHVRTLESLEKQSKPLTVVPLTDQDLKDGMDSLCHGLLQ